MPTHNPDEVVYSTNEVGDAPVDESLFGLEEPEFSGEIKRDEIVETLNKSLPPRGTYTTNPDENGPMTLFKTLLKARADHPGELDRRTITLSGKVTGTFKDRGEVSTFVRNVRLSPDVRPGMKFGTTELTGKNDAASTRWAEAVAAFEKTYKEFPKQEQQVIDFLENGTYSMVLSPIDGEIRVVRILAARGR